MAGTTFTITIILLAVFTGTNSESFKWNGYDVTRETTSKDGVKNFTQSLSRTVDGITTVDRTVTLTNVNNNKIIFVDHSITTTNKDVVTFDRTLEQFNAEGNLIMHDHFYNTSKSGTVSIGTNFTMVFNDGHKIIDYLEATQAKNRDPTINQLIETFSTKNKFIKVDHAFLITRADNSQEVYQNITVLNDDGSKTNDNSFATIRSDGDQNVDFSITKTNKDNKVTFIKRLVAIFEADNSTSVDTNATTINPSDISKIIDRCVTTRSKNGGKTIDQTVQYIDGDGNVLSTESNAKINTDGTISTSKSGDVNRMILTSERNFESAYLKFSSLQNTAHILSIDAADFQKKQNIETE